jgi:hypothetical protein
MSVDSLTPRAFHDRLLQMMQARGWRDPDGRAAEGLLLASSLASGRSCAGIALEQAVTEEFLARNDIRIPELRSALDDWMNDLRLGADPDVFELVTIDEIDSFSLVRSIEPGEVSGYSTSLDINERVVKHCIHSTLGDPYIDEDWGGERADVTTDRVKLDGQRLLTAFLLKGRSVPGPLLGSKLGTRGDQIVRLMEVRAELSVVQHVSEIPSETVDQLRYGVTALRVTGVEGAKASVWDGVDTARLLRAYGYIDEKGTLTAAGRTADDSLRKQRRTKSGH